MFGGLKQLGDLTQLASDSIQTTLNRAAGLDDQGNETNNGWGDDELEFDESPRAEDAEQVEAVERPPVGTPVDEAPLPPEGISMEEFEVLRVQASQASALKIELQRTLEELKAAKCLGSNTDWEQQAVESHQMSSRLAEELEALRAEHAAEIEQLQTQFESEKGELRAALESAPQEDENNEVVRELQAEVRKLQEGLEEVESEKAVLQDKLERAEALHASMTTQLREVRQGTAEATNREAEMVSSIEQLRADLQHAVTERADLQAAAEVHEASIAEVTAGLEAAVEDKMALEKAVESLQVELESSRAERQTIQDALQAAREETERQVAAAHAVEEEKDAAISSLREAKAVLEESKASTESEQAALRVSVEENEADLASLRSTVEQLEATNTSLTGQLRSSENDGDGDTACKVAELEGTAARLQSELREKEAAFNTLQADKESLSQRLADLTSQVEELTAFKETCSQLTSERDTLTTRFEGKVEEHTQTADQLVALQGEFSDLTAARDDLYTQLEEARSAEAQTAEQVSAVRTELEALHESQSRITSERDTLASQLEAAQTQQEEHDGAQLVALQAELDTLKGGYAQVSSERDGFASQMEAAQSQQADSEQTTEQVAALEKEVEILNSSYAQLSSERDTLVSQLEENQEAWREEVGSLSEQHTTLDNENSALKTRFSKLETRLSDKSHECTEQRDVLQRAQGELASLQMKLKQVTQADSCKELEVTTLRSNLEELKEEFSRSLTKEERRVKSLRKDRDELKARLGELNQTASRHEVQLSSQQGSANKLKEEAEELALSLGKEKERTRALVKERKSLDEELESTKTMLNQYVVKAKQWQDLKVVYENKESELNESLQVEEKKASDTVRECNELRAQIAEREREVAAVSTQLSMKEKSIESDAQAREDELLRERKDMEEEMAMLRVDMNNTMLEVDKMLRAKTAEVAEANRRAMSAEERVVALTDQVPEATRPLLQQIEELESSIEPMQAQLRGSERKYTTVQSELETLRQELRAREEDVKEGQRSIINLKNINVRLTHEAKVESEGRVAKLTTELHDKTNELERLAATIGQQKIQVEEALGERAAAAEEIVKLREKLEEAQRQAENAAPFAQPTAVLAPTHTAPPTPDLSASVASHNPESQPDQLQHLQAELHRYVLENSELRKAEENYSAQQNKLMMLTRKHETMLQLYGEKDEEYNMLKRKYEKAEASFKQQMDFFVEKLNDKR